MHQKYPASRQNFESIIEGNYLYVDKSMYIYELLQGTDMLFFARPRRFGKSMMISTLKAIYQGKKHLFEGLWITNNAQYEWQEYPVIDLDFSKSYQPTKIKQATKCERLRMIEPLIGFSST